MSCVLKGDVNPVQINSNITNNDVIIYFPCIFPIKHNPVHMLLRMFIFTNSFLAD